MRKPEEIIINGKTLREILDQHKVWIKSNGKEGICANLSESDLSNTNLNGVMLCRANIMKVNFSNCVLQNSDLSEANLIKANLSLANLDGAILSDSNLKAADLSKADLTNANLARSDLSGADLSDTELYKASLGGANLSCANLSRAFFQDTYLTKADFSGANLSEARLYGADLSANILSGAILIKTDLSKADLSYADLSSANLSFAELSDADLSYTNFTDANLYGADLNGVICVGTNLTNANIEGASIYGIAVWDVQIEGLNQKNLIITQEDNPIITVDNLEVAQFIYLLLNNKKIREVLDTITSKVVLILGRFTPERKIVIDAIRDVLRNHNYTPIVFDFDKPAGKNITETVSTLAHLARFVIADITDAKSIPQELQRIVPDLPSLPVQPIILESQYEYSMFKDFLDYPWVLSPHRYTNLEDLLTSLPEKVVKPALDKSKEIETRRKQNEDELYRR